MEENKEIDVSFVTDKQLWAGFKEFCREKTNQSGERTLIKTEATNAIRFYMEDYKKLGQFLAVGGGLFLAVGGGFFVKAGEFVNLSSSGVCDEITDINKNEVLQKGLIEGDWVQLRDLKLADRYNLCLSEYKYLKRKYKTMKIGFILLAVSFVLSCTYQLLNYLGV